MFGLFQRQRRPISRLDRGRHASPVGAQRQGALLRRRRWIFAAGVRGGEGATWNSRAPVKLFERRYFVGANSGRSYDVSPDGQRFLMIKGPKPTRRPRSSSSNTGTRSSSAWRPRSKGPASHYSAPSRNRVSCNPNRYTPAVCPHFRYASNLSWATEQRRPRVVNGTDMTGSCSRAFCLRRPTTRT